MAQQVLSVAFDRGKRCWSMPLFEQPKVNIADDPLLKHSCVIDYLTKCVILLDGARLASATSLHGLSMQGDKLQRARIGQASRGRVLTGLTRVNTKVTGGYRADRLADHPL